jgi:phosphocarrier protein HPr
MTPFITVEITNKKGLHARASAKFVKTVSSFVADVTVIKTGANEESNIPVGGTSILGLLMLGADPGSLLHISATGTQANEVLAALKELIDNKFGESE